MKKSYDMWRLGSPYDYDDEEPEYEGYVKKEDLPNFDDTRDYLKGIIDALYESSDLKLLEMMLGEICFQYGVEMDIKELKIQEKKMNNEVATTNNTEIMISDIKNTQKMCMELMKAPHYQKIGAAGIYAIVEKAKSIGVSPLDSLNGGMYFVKGKVEMTSSMMNQLIRMNGHSVTKDKKSNDTICILHGKRADNGDTWVESFSMEEAVRAKITLCRAKTGEIIDGPWQKFPRDMLFARSLSRLARQLFPDVIKGCYVQGEISEATPINEPVVDVTPNIITKEQYRELESQLGDNVELRTKMLGFVKERFSIETLQDMPVSFYDYCITRATEARLEIEASESKAIGGE